MHIHLVAGARPNFMKIAPLARALDARPVKFYGKVCQLLCKQIHFPYLSQSFLFDAVHGTGRSAV